MSTTTAPRTNRFPGTCTCGAKVPAGQGILTGTPGNWATACGPEMAEAHMVNLEAKAAGISIAPARVSIEDAGVYVLPDGRIVKAQANRAKTHTYTMVWTVIGGERLVDATEERVHGEWTYAPHLMGEVTASGRKMTLDEAKAFILRYGKCVRCSRGLKAAQSVEAGIGPVCKKWFTFA